MEKPQKWEKHKKASGYFSGKCHNSDIWGKKYVNLVYLYLNRRFMGVSIQNLVQKSKDFPGGEMHGFSRKIREIEKLPKNG